MPTRNEYIAQAQKNERFAHSIADEFAEWAVTALFYAVVHYGRALLSAKGSRWITTHQGFESEFLRAVQDRRLFNHYRRLKDESEHARYDCVAYTKQEALDFETKFLEPFRDAVVKLL